MSKVTMQEKQETKMRIETAALDVFTRKGIQNASIREIAEKAGVGASTIYGYYTSKSLLFIEIILPTIESRNTLNIALDNLEIRNLKLDEVATILSDAVFLLPSSVLNLDKKIIKEFHRVMFSLSSSGEIKKKMETFLNEDMSIIITSFFNRLIKEEVIKVELDTADYAKFILNMMRAVFLEYIIIGELTEEACYLKLKEMIRLSLIGKI